MTCCRRLSVRIPSYEDRNALRIQHHRLVDEGSRSAGMVNTKPDRRDFEMEGRDLDRRIADPKQLLVEMEPHPFFERDRLSIQAKERP